MRAATKKGRQLVCIAPPKNIFLYNRPRLTDFGQESVSVLRICTNGKLHRRTKCLCS